jgi:hypothetical protein
MRPVPAFLMNSPMPLSPNAHGAYSLWSRSRNLVEDPG